MLWAGPPKKKEVIMIAVRKIIPMISLGVLFLLCMGGTAEAETSTLIGPGWTCRMDGLGYLDLTQEAA